MKHPILTLSLLLSSVSSFSQFLTQIPLNASRGFVENKGQIVNQYDEPNHEVLYLLNGNGLNVQLRKAGFSYDCWTDVGPDGERMAPDFHRIDISFENSNVPEIVTASESADYENFYLRGRETTHVRNFQSITYRNLYEGIDIEFKMNPAMPMGFEYLIHAAPGADLSQISLRYSGQLSMTVEKNSIQLKTTFGNLTEIIPASWTLPGREMAEVSFVLVRDNTIGFECALNSSDLRLVIDPSPQILWATYYGGTNVEFGLFMDHGNNGEIVITGTTLSNSGIATTGTHQLVYSGIGMAGDAMIVKFDHNGIRVWGTYFGGTSSDGIHSVKLSSANDIVFAGLATSANGVAFGNSHQGTYGGEYDGFLGVLNDDGTMNWSTYVGGSQTDGIFDLCLDNDDIIYFVGASGSQGYFGINTQEGSDLAGGNDAIIGAFNMQGTLLWSRYFGGGGNDGFASAKLRNGILYVTGVTDSEDLLTTGGLNDELTSFSNVFLASFDLMGSLVNCSYTAVSAENYEQTYVGLDLINSDVLLFGNCSVINLATEGVHQEQTAGFADGYLAIIKDDFSNVEWFTYYGGAFSDIIRDVVILNDKIVVVGESQSESGISTPGAIQENWVPGGGFLLYQDAIFSIFSLSGELLYGTYFGGDKLDRFTAIVADSEGSVIVAGSVGSNNMATADSFLPSNPSPGFSSGFLLKVDINTLVEELESLGSSISVFPNPTNSGSVRIESETDLKSWQLTDNRGALVAERNGILSKAETINTAGLSVGLYLLRLVAADGRFVVKKVVVE